MNKCTECGRPTRGTRCRTCWKAHARLEFLRATAAEDRLVLDFVDQEGLSARKVADRLGVSRVRAHQKIRDARRREELRETSLQAATSGA